MYELLGEIAIQEGEFDKAIAYFNDAIGLAKNMNDLTHLITLREGVQTQVEVSRKYDVNLVDIIKQKQQQLIAGF